MTRALSSDLRVRVIAAVSSGESCRGVAARFGVAGVVGREVAPALSRDRIGGAGKDGRTSQAGLGAASGVHRGADQADATSDAARAEGRTGRTRLEGLPSRGLDLPAA